MATQSKYAVNTKLDETSKTAISTSLTIEWDVSQEELQALAAKTVIITAQRLWRTAKRIPETDTIRASEVGKRAARVVVVSPQEYAKTASDDELGAMVAALEALKRERAELAKASRKELVSA